MLQMRFPNENPGDTSEQRARHEAVFNERKQQSNAVEIAGDGELSHYTRNSELDKAHGALQVYQRLVFTDPVAFRYLQDDPSTEVISPHEELIGYELYLVEQWACSRLHPTFIITTFTGLPHHKVLAGVLSVPTDETQWSPRLRIYLKAISNFHARKKETSLGTLMVTNLSNFPSALTVIAIPGGDLKDHRDTFIVNENMKRLGCSGRAGLNLSPPTGATNAKFIQLYRTSERLSTTEAVVELVKLCQIALVIFTRLAPVYADGLLCDLTEGAINDWWTKVGMEYYIVEPNDGILGPTTVAALLGLFLGARNRLNAYGAPVSKDAFDLKALKRGIGYFQKSQKLPRSRRLDRQTLDRLHRVTSKAANSEGWMVPRAVKSTVAELGGKGGEMVMGMVARDKAGIAEVETLDIKKFINTISGERCKWLWYGKPKKSHAQDFFNNLAGEEDVVLSAEENPGNTGLGRKKEAVNEHGIAGHSHPDRIYSDNAQDSQISLDVSEKDQAFRKAVLKSVTGRMSDARFGLGRFKDVVGIPSLRNHYHKQSKENMLSPSAETRRSLLPNEDQTLASGFKHTSSEGHDTGQHRINDRFHVSDASQDETEQQARGNGMALICHGEMTGQDLSYGNTDQENYASLTKSYDSKPSTSSLSPRPWVDMQRESLATRTSESLQQWAVGGSISSQSLPLATRRPDNCSRPPYLPRCTSFSILEDILVGENPDSVILAADTRSFDGVNNSWGLQQSASLQANRRARQMEHLKNFFSSFVDARKDGLEDLQVQANTVHNEIGIHYLQAAEQHNTLRNATTDLIREEGASLSEAFKDMEVLGAKLEYELNALNYRVEDVEVAMSDFERQVLDLEDRMQSLGNDDSYEDAWPLKIWRFVTRRNGGSTNSP